MKQQRYLGGNPAEIRRCKSCDDALNEKHATNGFFCKHCDTKNKYGISDLQTCFQGSVISLED